MTNDQPMLKVSNLSKTFVLGSRFQRGGIQHLQAIKNVSFEVVKGEVLGLVGESGCGKSTLGRTILRLYDVTQGQILFKGRDITHLSQRALRPLRSEMQMVFQDPYSSLNPRRRIGDLIAEPLRVHHFGNEKAVRQRLLELMELVNLPEDFLKRYPHEFSGGQRQRIGIARALALSPSLIVADEPVSALDVSVQAQIVNLFMDLQAKLGLTYVFVAHDLSVVRQIATRTAVMYLGTMVELGETDRVLHHPLHPYTAALISAVPEPDPEGNMKQRVVLKGEPPSPTNPPSGCRFHTRCPIAKPLCKEQAPELLRVSENHSVACHFPLS